MGFFVVSWDGLGFPWRHLRFIGIFLGLSWILWYSLGSFGISWAFLKDLDEIPCDYLRWFGISMGLLGIHWDPLGLFWILWDYFGLFGFSGILREFHWTFKGSWWDFLWLVEMVWDFHWITRDLLGFPEDFLRDIHGITWDSFKIHTILWDLLELMGSPWDSLGFLASFWVSWSSLGSLGILRHPMTPDSIQEILNMPKVNQWIHQQIHVNSFIQSMNQFKFQFQF